MSAFQQLKDRNLAARKAGDTVAKTIYTVLIGELERQGDPGQEVSDAMVSTTAGKIIAGIDTLLAATTPCETLTREKELLSAFVIEKASDAEVAAVVTAYIAANEGTTIKQMGLIMKELKIQIGDRLDAGRASAIVKSSLA